LIGRAKKKKAHGAVISPRLVDLREIKIYLLKQRGTPGEGNGGEMLLLMLLLAGCWSSRALRAACVKIPVVRV
jgi:hypothetical protein